MSFKGKKWISPKSKGNSKSKSNFVDSSKSFFQFHLPYSTPKTQKINFLEQCPNKASVRKFNLKTVTPSPSNRWKYTELMAETPNFERTKCIYSSIFQRELTRTMDSQRCSFRPSCCVRAAAQTDTARSRCKTQKICWQGSAGLLECPGWVQASHMTFVWRYRTPAGV